MYPEADFVPISALQHYVVCQRQCALIHLENCWIENRSTAQGRVLHERIDRGGLELRNSVKRSFDVPVRSFSMGLFGKADIVEYYKVAGQPLKPYPIESKLGRPKVGDEDRVQLCAQAMCLEEMLHISIPAGAIYYAKTRRRTEITFDENLRSITRATAAAVHDLFRNATTPSHPSVAPCKTCSLRPACRPDLSIGPTRVKDWLDAQLSRIE